MIKIIIKIIALAILISGFSTLTSCDNSSSDPVEEVKDIINNQNNNVNLIEISIINDHQIDLNQNAPEINFTVSDPATSAETLTITVTSSNENLIPNSTDNLKVEGTDQDRKIIITPLAETTGRTLITVKVSNGYFAKEKSFYFTVLEPLDLTNPTITAISDLSIDEDATTNFIEFSVSDQETALNDLIIRAFSKNNELIPNDPANIIVTPGDDNKYSIKLIPAENEFGSSEIIVKITDLGGNSVEEKFTLFVNSINDIPIASQSTYTVNKNKEFIFTSSLFNINDPDNTNFNIILTSLPVKGLLIKKINELEQEITLEDSPFTTVDLLNPSIDIIYRHTADNTINDEFTFKVKDLNQAESEEVSFILKVNSRPAITKYSFPEGYRLDEGSTVQITSNDLIVTDEDDNIFNFIITSLPLKGNILKNNQPLGLNEKFSSIDLDSGLIRYQHNANDTMPDSFKVKAEDTNNWGSAEVTFLITINDLPEIGALTQDGETIIDDNIYIVENYPSSTNWIICYFEILDNDDNYQEGDIGINNIYNRQSSYLEELYDFPTPYANSSSCLESNSCMISFGAEKVSIAFYHKCLYDENNLNNNTKTIEIGIINKNSDNSQSFDFITSRTLNINILKRPNIKFYSDPGYTNEINDNFTRSGKTKGDSWDGSSYYIISSKGITQTIYYQVDHIYSLKDHDKDLGTNKNNDYNYNDWDIDYNFSEGSFSNDNKIYQGYFDITLNEPGQGYLRLDFYNQEIHGEKTYTPSEHYYLYIDLKPTLNIISKDLYELFSDTTEDITLDLKNIIDYYHIEDSNDIDINIKQIDGETPSSYFEINSTNLDLETGSTTVNIKVKDGISIEQDETENVILKIAVSETTFISNELEILVHPDNKPPQINPEQFRQHEIEMTQTNDFSIDFAVTSNGITENVEILGELDIRIIILENDSLIDGDYLEDFMVGENTFKKVKSEKITKNGSDVSVNLKLADSSNTGVVKIYLEVSDGEFTVKTNVFSLVVYDNNYTVCSSGCSYSQVKDALDVIKNDGGTDYFIYIKPTINGNILEEQTFEISDLADNSINFDASFQDKAVSIVGTPDEPNKTVLKGKSGENFSTVIYIYINNLNKAITFDGLSFTNFDSAYGKLVYISKSKVIFKNIIIKDNILDNAMFGFVQAWNYSEIDFLNLVAKDNGSDDEPIDMFFFAGHSTIKMLNTILTNNIAGYYGLFRIDYSNVALAHCTIYKNRVSNKYQVEHKTPNVFYLERGAQTIVTNSIIWDNKQSYTQKDLNGDEQTVENNYIAHLTPDFGENPDLTILKFYHCCLPYITTENYYDNIITYYNGFSTSKYAMSISSSNNSNPNIIPYKYHLNSNSSCLNGGDDSNLYFYFGYGTPSIYVNNYIKFDPFYTPRSGNSNNDIGAIESKSFLDDNNNQIDDLWEIAYEFENQATADPDSDGCDNLCEYYHGTNPEQADTDSDGLNDGFEIANDLDPNDSNSY